MTAGTNNFLPFGTGSSPNVIDDATYNALTARGTGFQSGVAQSQQLNKVWRQSSVIAAAVGQLIANTGANATDSDTIANLVAYIRTALAGSHSTSTALSAATTLTASQAGTVFQLQSGAGAYAVTLPAASAVVPGTCYSFFNINNSYTHTVQRGGTDVIYVNGNTVNSISIAPGDTLTVASNGSNAWIPVSGSAHLPYSAVMSGANWTTPPQFDNTTKHATTEFVQRALGNYQQILTVSTNTTLTAAQSGALVNAGGTITITLPAPTTAGLRYVVRSYSNAGTITLSTPSGVFFGSLPDSVATTMAIGNRSMVELVSDGSNWAYQSSMAQGSLSSSGYQKLPSGLILQWGTSSVAASGTLVYLPVAFPNNFFHVGSGRSAINGSIALYCYKNSLANFYIDFADASTSSAETWFAIGN